MSRRERPTSVLAAPWLHLEPQPSWELVRRHGQLRGYRQGQLIKGPHDRADGVGLLLRGSIRVQAVGGEGLQRTLWVMAPQSTFGEAALFHGVPYMHYLHALTDCEVVYFAPEVLRDVIVPQHPELAFFLFSNLARKSYILSNQLEETMFLDSFARIAKLLYQAAEELRAGRGGASRGVELEVTHAEIAELLGLHRVTVTNAVNRLRRQGLLRKGTRRLVVEDAAGLRALFGALEE
jgi:CRP-like cAMP-binding protein